MVLANFLLQSLYLPGYDREENKEKGKGDLRCVCIRESKQERQRASGEKREKGVWEGSLWTAKPMRHITWQLTCLKGTGRQAGQAYMSPSLSLALSLSLTPEGWRTQEESGHSAAEQAARRPGRSNNGELYNSGALSSLCLSIYLWWIVMTAHLQSTCLIWNGLRGGYHSQSP